MNFMRSGVVIAYRERSYLTFEKCFDIDVDVFTLERDNAAVPIYMSQGKRGPNHKITMNLSNGHLSYVNYTKAYLLKFSCDGCGRHFDRLSHLKRHRGNCTRASRKVFNFDHYKPTQSIFEKLECEGIFVNESERRYPWFATFDCESYQENIPPQSGGTQWVTKHNVISLSVASNVSNIIDGEYEFNFREPKCFKGKDPQLLINQAVNYIKSISNAAGTLARRRFSNVIDELNEKIAEYADVKEAEKDRDFEEHEEDMLSRRRRGGGRGNSQKRQQKRYSEGTPETVERVIHARLLQQFTCPWFQ